MKKLPIHEIRHGLITVKVWRKKTRQGMRFSITVLRLFRDGDHWKQSARFGRDDIPVLRLVLDEAHTWIFQHSTPPHDREDS